MIGKYSSAMSSKSTGRRGGALMPAPAAVPHTGAAMASLIPPLSDVLSEWRRRIEANREQVARLREIPEEADFYAPVTRTFRAPDPRQVDDPIVDVLRGLLQAGDTLLDIGAGGGRYALPMALMAREVIAVDPSPGMLATLTAGATEHEVRNVRAVQAAWPMPEPPSADVTLAANVLYDIDDVLAFVRAMEASTRRLCVAVLSEEVPPAPIDRLWPVVHAEARDELPALREFLQLLLARRTLFEVRLTERPPTSWARPEDALAQARRHTWVEPGGAKDMALQALLRERLVEHDGRLAFGWEPVRIGIVSWQPSSAA